MKIEIHWGSQGLEQLARIPGTAAVLVAVSGINGLLPTLAALDTGATIALANKETLVAGGALVTRLVREKKAKIIPVDSEHSAIFQCLEEENHQAIAKLHLTASGGPFLKYTREQLAEVTPAKALQHPNWNMGAKITIDSAGLINKGLEVIEAYWLFQVPYEKIEVVVHPQSIIHSMVHYVDGSILAQLGMPDMRVPIQYALTYPARRANPYPQLDVVQLKDLTFQAPDHQKFPGLLLAYEAGKAGGTLPAVYNAANEIAVELFLGERIKFTQIPVLIERVMQAYANTPGECLEQILEADVWARRMAQDMYRKILA